MTTDQPQEETPARPPVVAIVGRPNVGKSTLFNRLCGRRRAIVENVPGVTVDRHYGESNFGTSRYTIIDTGGLDPEAVGDIQLEMRAQAMLAVDEADVIFLMFDGRVPPAPADYEVTELIRRSGKPAFYLVNKIDGPRHEVEAVDYYSLGIDPVFMVSAEHGLGIGDLQEAVEKRLPGATGEKSEEDEDLCRVAVIGRPNSGKSTLINRLLGEYRHAVTPIAGTTRDAIDSLITRGESRYLFIDTAGIRRKRKIFDEVERVTVFRALKAIDRADVAVILIDAELGMNEQDVKIAAFAHDKGKAALIVVNKWDLIEKETNTARDFEADVRDKLKFMPYAQFVFVSALTGKRVENIFTVVDQAFTQARRRIGTGDLNRMLGEATAYQPPPNKGGRRLKIFYATQITVKPPTILLSVNHKELLHFSYERYLQNRLREAFGFEGTPIRLLTRERSRPDKDEDRLP